MGSELGRVTNSSNAQCRHKTFGACLLPTSRSSQIKHQSKWIERGNRVAGPMRAEGQALLSLLMFFASRHGPRV